MNLQIKILAGNTLYSYWDNSKLKFDDIKTNLEHILLYLETYPLEKYIEDISQTDANWKKADKEWILPIWYPKVQKTNLKKYAIIVAKPIKHYHKDENCELKSFYTFDEALNWINE
ncbi:MAG: hypothetical protein HF967_02955 [Methanosarcinales archaeon]|nr:hypothetical protein [Methanosarcinales archaeon]